MNNVKTQFKTELCTNNEHVIAKAYKLLLRLETGKKNKLKVQDKTGKNFGYNIRIDGRECG